MKTRKSREAGERCKMCDNGSVVRVERGNLVYLECDWCDEWSVEKKEPDANGDSKRSRR